MKKLVLICAVAVSGAYGLSATEYTMNNVGITKVYLSHATNYVGSVAPANVGSTAGLDDSIVATDPVDFAQTLLANWNGTTYVGAFVGDIWRNLEWSGYNYWWTTLHVKDLSNFQGLVYTTGPYNAISVDDGTSIPQVDMSYGLQLTAKSGKPLAIGKASGFGAVNFNGRDVNDTTAGELTVADPLFGPFSHLMAPYRGITFTGHSEEVGVVGDPYLHLDATATDSLVTAEAGGQRRVTRWNDVRGEGRPYATSTANKFVPWLSTDAATGLQVVDFGASACDFGWPVDNCWNGRRTGDYMGYAGTTLGKCGWLKLDQKVTNIREVFVVLKEAHLYNCQAYFLGDDTGPDGVQNFRRGYFDEAANGGKFESAYYQLTTLFRDHKNTSAIQAGDVRLDGQRVRFNHPASLCDRLHVLSVGTAADTSADRIADNGYGTCNVNSSTKRRWCIGGFTLGEMLVYTNALTSAERRRVNAYLKAKWQKGECARDVDFGTVAQRSPAVLGVDGGTIRSLKTTVSGDRLTKTGSGVYDGGVPPKGPFVLDVRGGQVTFTKGFATPSASPTKPAWGSDIWIDADNEATRTMDGSSVTKIVHCENGGTNEAGYATYVARGSTALAHPTLVADELVGGRAHSVLDFGTYRSGKSVVGDETIGAVYKKVPQSTKAGAAVDTVSGVNGNYKTKAGFLVFKAKDVCATIIGTRDGNDYRRDEKSTGNLFADNPDASIMAGEYFALDGERIASRGTAIPTGEYHVLSYRFSRPLRISTLAGRQETLGQVGGLRVGEWIQYDRELSSEEFRDTEAYLLSKWLGKAHPDVKAATGETAAKIVSATYAAEATPVLESDFALEIGGVSADGSFEKAGAGAATIARLGTTITNLTVSGGAVTAGASVESLMAHALFRFDASDATTITTEKDPSGNDWVTEWRDKNGNGYTAKPLNTAEFVITNKPWLKTVEINGVEKRTIDLGSHIIVDKTGGAFVSTNDATGFQLVKPDGTTGWSGNMREWIVVAKDLHTGRDTTSAGRIADHAPILSGSKLTWRNIDELHDYMTHPIYQSVTQPSRAYNGGECHYKCRCDGEAVGYNYRLWEAKDRSKHNFHVLSMAYVTNHVDWTFKVRQLGAETCRISNCASIGGQQLCEIMVFQEPLSDLDRTNVTAYLMKKWLSSETQVLPNRDFGTVGVKGGASLDLDLDGWPSVSVGNLICGGSLKLSRALAVNEGAEFAVAMTGPNAVEGLTVDGSVGLPQRATVKLTVADGLKGNRQFRGSYPILKATSLGDADISDWTLDYPKWIEQYVQPRLRKIGDTVFLDMPQNGIVLIVR